MDTRFDVAASERRLYRDAAVLVAFLAVAEVVLLWNLLA